jgi:hypothetical protein
MAELRTKNVSVVLEYQAEIPWMSSNSAKPINPKT